jgi:FSR family fosmidomycin resistance protein-like MFS transporter
MNSRPAKTPLLQCSLAHALNHSQILLIAALLPFFQALYDLSYLKTAGIMAFYLISYAVANPLAAVLVKKYSKKFLVFLGKLASGFSLTAMAASGGYVSLLLLQIPYGASGGLYHPSGTSILAESYDKKLRARVMGIHGFGSSMGMIAGPLIVGYFLTAHDHRAALYFFAALSLAMGGVFYATVAERPMERRAQRKGNMRWVTMAFAMRESVFWGIKAFIPLYAVAIHGFTISSAAALLALLPIVGLSANMLGGYLGDRFDRLRIAQGAVTFTALSLTGFYFLQDKALFQLLVAATALGIYMTLPLFDSIVADVSPEEGYVKAYGAMYGLGFFLGAAVTLGTGILSDILDPRGSFILMAAIMVLCSIALSRAEVKAF